MDKEKRSIGQISTTTTQITKEGLFTVDIFLTAQRYE